MMSLRRFIGGAVAGMLLFSNVSLFAAGPLDLVPKDAAIVGRIKAPQASLEKVAGFVNQGAPGFGFVVLGQANGLGALISNTTLGGVDLSKDWYFVAFVEKNAPPSVVFIVPATDEKDLKEAVGSNFSFVTSDNFVAYSEDAAATELVAACKAGKSKSISSIMEKRATALFDESDISIHVNVAKLRETYAEEILAADKQLDDAIEGIKALTAGAAAQSPGVNLDAVWEMYGSIGHKVLQGVRDSESFSFGVKVSNEALTIEELLIVNKDSASDKFLQSHPTNDLSLITKQPASQIAYFAGAGDFKAMTKWSFDFSSKMIAGNEDSKKKMAKLQEDMAEIKVGSMAGSFGLNAPSDEGIVNAIIAMEANPTAKMRELGRRAQQELKIELPGVKQEIALKIDAEKVGDVTVDLINLKQEYSDELPGAEMQRQIMAVAYGKNGVSQRIATTKTHFVQTIGGGSEGMKTALAALQASSTATPAALAKSRSRQLEKANLLFMLDLPTLVQRAALVADELVKSEAVPPLPVPIPAAQIKAVKLDPSYITFAAGTEPQGLRLRSEVPSATVAGFFKLFQAANMAGRGGPRGR